MIPLQPVQSSKAVYPDASTNSGNDPNTAAYVLLENLVDGDLDTAPIQKRLTSVTAAIELVVKAAKCDEDHLQAALSEPVLRGKETIEVFNLLREGCSVGQVSARLKVSVSTVRYHIRKIIKAYGTRSYEEAIRIAKRHEARDS